MPAASLTSFAPDQDPLSPGVITDANDFVPSVVGFRTLPDILIVTEPLPGPCRGAAALTFADGVQWIVAACCDDDGSNVTLNTIPATALNGTTPASWNTEIMSFPPGPAGKWRFDVWTNQVIYDTTTGQQLRTAELGDQQIIGVDGVHQPVYATRASLESNPSTAWHILLGIPSGFNTDGTPILAPPPIASHVAASDFFLFLIGEAEADIPVGNLPVVTNRWWASPNSAVWTLNSAAPFESVSGRLGQTSGPITGIMAQRSTMIIYKANATYIGQLTQPPLLWEFSEASRQVGAQGQEGILPIRDVHNFVGPDDFFTMDGFAITPIQNALRRWFKDRTSTVNRANVSSRFDQQRSCAFIHFTLANAADQRMLGEWIVLNIVTGQWSTGHLNVQATIAQPIVVAADSATGIILADGTLGVYLQDGPRTTPAYIVTGDYGDRHMMYQTKPARPAFTILNGLPTLTPLTQYVSGGAYSSVTRKFESDIDYQPGHTVELTPDGWFQLLSTGRLHRFRLVCDDDCELGNIELELAKVGDR